MTFRKILLAYDFSDPANRALSFAAQLATQLGSELHLVNVQVDIDDGSSASEVGIPRPSQDQTERYMRFLHGELHNAARTVVHELSDKLTYHVLRGDPVRRIEALAEELTIGETTVHVLPSAASNRRPESACIRRFAT